MSELKVLIGKRIRDLRKSRKLTQEQLAELIGIGTPNISYLENGKFAPSIETLEKLAQVFQIEPYEIYMTAPYKSEAQIKEEMFPALEKNSTLLRMVYKFFITIR